jgi:fumarylacetoacetase
VESAQAPGTDFPIQNLPLGVFRRRGDPASRVGVAIGDAVLDFATCARESLFEEMDGRHAAALADACAAPTLGPLMALGRPVWRALRAEVSALLRTDGAGYEHFKRLGDALLVPMADTEPLVPAAIGDYTDFYASVYHATNVGSMFRPDNPLLPNYKHVPIGYHGRASSIVASGTPVRRPAGQTKDPAGERPVWGASRSLDYECEVGAFVGPGNPLGTAVPLAEAEARIFGLCLVNDWSARDIQAWEYQPLGPFLAKSFATTVSPWVVTLDALAPFRAPAFARPDGDPAPLPYLDDPRDRARGSSR